MLLALVLKIYEWIHVFSGFPERLSAGDPKKASRADKVSSAVLKIATIKEEDEEKLLTREERWNKLENYPRGSSEGPPRSPSTTKRRVALLMSRATMIALFLMSDLLSYLDVDAAATRETRATHLGGLLAGALASAALAAASAALRQTAPLSKLEGDLNTTD